MYLLTKVEEIEITTRFFNEKEHARRVMSEEYHEAKSRINADEAVILPEKAWVIGSQNIIWEICEVPAEIKESESRYVTVSVDGTITVKVNEPDTEEAAVKALDHVYDMDFGELENLGFRVIQVE